MSGERGTDRGLLDPVVCVPSEELTEPTHLTGGAGGTLCGSHGVAVFVGDDRATCQWCLEVQQTIQGVVDARLAAAQFAQFADSMRAVMEALAVPALESVERLRVAWPRVAKPAVRRCEGCYLPMREDFACDCYVCDLCGTTTPCERLAGRPRWRRWLDWLMGMDS